MAQGIAGRSAVIEVQRTFGAQPGAVFRAWTDPAVLAKWLAPRPYCCESAELDVRVGGRYRIAMYNPETGNKPVVGGVYETVEPGRRLAFTWKWENNESWQDDSRVIVEFSAVEGGTTVRLVHERLPNDKEREGHVKGWTACLEQLGEEC